MKRIFQEPIKLATFPVKSGEVLEDGDIVGFKKGYIYKCVTAELEDYDAFGIIVDESANLDGAKATTQDGNVSGGKDNVGIKGDKTARICLIEGLVEGILATGKTGLAGKSCYAVDNIYFTDDTIGLPAARLVGKFVRQLDTAGTRWLVKFDSNLT